MSDVRDKPKLFLYSLILPTLWISIGVITDWLAPGKRLGLFGLFIVLFATTFGMSWLQARKFRRRFTNKEMWSLVGYCFAWAFLAESLGLFYAMSFPEEVGFDIDLETAKITILVTAVIDFVFVWLALRNWSPKFIDWYLRKNKTDTA